jgi:glycosyltransferase involved in cell wall biosynthesis
VRIGWMAYPMPEGSLARGYSHSAAGIFLALRATIGDDLVPMDGRDDGPPPPTVLHYCPPHFFRPVPGATNALFTMWEAPVLPDDVVEVLRTADRLIVPSTFCAQTWASYGFRAAIAPLGLATDYLEGPIFRSSLINPRGPLRFLWCGSSSQRKGCDQLVPAWAAAWGTIVRHQLTVKMLGDGSRQDLGRGIVLDQRDLDAAGMLELYRETDVLLHPSRGEGFGLVLLEAMAAGCLAIAVPLGGVTDFFGPGLGIVPNASRLTTAVYAGKRIRFPEPGPEDLAQCMLAVEAGWGGPVMEALRDAGCRSARRFGWGFTAARIVGALVDQRGALSAQGDHGALVH